MMYALRAVPLGSSQSSQAVVREAVTFREGQHGARIIVVDAGRHGTGLRRPRAPQPPRKASHATERTGMALFSHLLSRIWGHADTAAPTAASTVGEPAATPSSAAPAAAPAAPAPPAAPVDVAAVLNGLAATHAERLDWQHSIVDLLKLVGLDSSLAARKELATDLHYTGELDGSAAMNLWLHKEVMKKLADNGGKVPQELLD
jgi:Domain of unknown function (DUF3597)